jgi:hypothetical protein
LEEGPRRRDVAEAQEKCRGVEVEARREQAPRQQALDLGREGETLVCERVIERLDPEPVPCQHQLVLLLIPESHREHPAQPVDERGAPLLVEVDDRLGVACAREPMTACTQFPSKRVKVEDLAVEHKFRGADLIGAGLMAAGEIDNAEPTHAEGNPATVEVTRLVWAPMTHHVRHCEQTLSRNRRIGWLDASDAAYSAHRRAPRPAASSSAGG